MRRLATQRSNSCDAASVLSGFGFVPTRNLSLPNLRPKHRIRHSGPRVSFEHLASNQKFRAILKILNDEQMDQDVLRTWLNADRNDGETALHVLVRYQPPEKLVDLLAKKMIHLSDPETCCWNQNSDAVFIPENSRDDHGRTPLHIAAEAGCHFGVIDRLLEGETCVMPAVTKDDYGRFPLHWACANPSGIARGLSSRSRSSFRSFMSSSRRLAFSRRTSANKLSNPELLENMINVIRMLLKVYPEAASVPDEDGMTPYRLAQHFQADSSVLEVLADAVKTYQKPGGSTMCEDSEFTAFELSVDLSRGSTHGIDDIEDDVSSLGVDEAGKSLDIPLPSLYNGPSARPHDIFIDPDHTESESVIKRCWFI